MIQDFIIFNEEQTLNRIKSDLLPELSIQIYDNSTIPFTEIDLTGKTVTFSMKKFKATEAKISNQLFTEVDEATGQYKFEFEATDVDEIGTYNCEIAIVDTGKKRTLDRKFQIVISDNF